MKKKLLMVIFGISIVFAVLAICAPILPIMLPEWSMHKNKASWLGLFLFVASASLAQVVSPVEIKDPELRALQQQYIDDLRLAGQDILATQFDYPFYLAAS